MHLKISGPISFLVTASHISNFKCLILKVRSKIAHKKPLENVNYIVVTSGFKSKAALFT